MPHAMRGRRTGRPPTCGDRRGGLWRRMPHLLGGGNPGEPPPSSSHPPPAPLPPISQVDAGTMSRSPRGGGYLWYAPLPPPVGKHRRAQDPRPAPWAHGTVPGTAFAQSSHAHCWWRLSSPGAPMALLFLLAHCRPIRGSLVHVCDCEEARGTYPVAQRAEKFFSAAVLCGLTRGWFLGSVCKPTPDGFALSPSVALSSSLVVCFGVCDARDSREPPLQRTRSALSLCTNTLMWWLRSMVLHPAVHRIARVGMSVCSKGRETHRGVCRPLHHLTPDNNRRWARPPPR